MLLTITYFFISHTFDGMQYLVHLFHILSSYGPYFCFYFHLSKNNIIKIKQ